MCLGVKYTVSLKRPDGSLVKVNPRYHVFSRGDEFKILAFYNSPGVVKFIDIYLSGVENDLGTATTTKAYKGTYLPAS